MLVVVALAASATYILQEQRLRIPILEEKPFELKAEFETAQAVIPGQGQTIRVAGVRIGDVAEVELEDGKRGRDVRDRAQVPADLQGRDDPAAPATGLRTCSSSSTRARRRRARSRRAATIPVANTAPDVNLDEILEALDGDTQAYLRLLLVGAGKGLEGRGKDLGELLGTLGPINRDLAKLNSQGRRAQGATSRA